MPTEIWLIRHGESESNAGLPTTTTATVALTPRGQRQAARIAASIDRRPDCIVSSPYLRARQTAAPLIARYPAAVREEWPVQEFTYLDLPTDRPTTPEERAPRSDAFWLRSDPFYREGPQTESFADLIMRAQQFLQRAQSLPTGFVVIFSHGLFMRAVLWTLLVNPEVLTPELMRRCRRFMGGFSVPNGSIIRLLGAAGQIYFGAVVTAHVAGSDDEPDVALLT